MIQCSSVNVVTTVQPGLNTVPYNDVSNFIYATRSIILKPELYMKLEPIALQKEGVFSYVTSYLCMLLIIKLLY